MTAKSPEEEREEAERKMIAAHRESVMVYLQRRLEEAGRVQSGMMEVRLGREVEKSKSVLYKARLADGIPYAVEEDGAPLGKRQQQAQDRPKSFGQNVADDRLSQEQQQLFAEENNELLNHYENQLDQINAAERSILEISELQSTLVANIQMQSEHIDQLVQDSYLTTENLGKGNKELKRASERRSTAQGLFYASCVFATFLVVWDLVF